MSFQRRGRSVGALLGGWLALLACVSAAGAARAGPIELHRFDWNRAVLPGSVCGVDHPIRLQTGSANVHSPRWPALSRIDVARGSVVYGDLSGNGHDAAALQVVCANLGGTAAGQLAFAVVVYLPGPRAPIALGVLTPRLRAGGSHTPILTPISIRRDRVTVAEVYYGSHDPDCCPSGKATTVWVLGAGRFRPLSTVVERKPAR